MEQQFDQAEAFALADDADDRSNGAVTVPERRGNWIANSRSVRNHPLVGYGQPVKPANPSKGAYSRNEAWTDLMMEAAYCDGEVRLQGLTVSLKRGQAAVSLRFLASRWNWTVKTVRGWLPQLVRANMIAFSEGHTPPSEKGTRQDRLCSVITICNYEKYQIAAERRGTAQGTARLKKGHESNNNKKQLTPLPLTGQGERVKAVRDLVARQQAPAPSTEAGEALAAYNAAAERHAWVPKPAASLSPTEIRRLEARVREIGGAEAFRRAMLAVPGSRLEGDWSRRVRPDLAYVLSTGTSNGDLLRGLLDLAAMAADTSSHWWANHAKRDRVTVRQWREAIVLTVTPEHWSIENLGFEPSDPRCVIPPDVFDAATIAHCERCGFDVPNERRPTPLVLLAPSPPPFAGRASA